MTVGFQTEMKKNIYTKYKRNLNIRVGYRRRRFGSRDDVIRVKGYFVCCCSKSISLPERDQPPPFSLDLP
ncbi:hypothetical protein T05_12543 [Trichinella murrelli]|uniref:Uncharacterized protein n=1 Tax=Trichinella murrelli TaxID=144512 RepID=A0A0V0U404_9BILA|nr:hypothetical protein T05_12543 [Trichinella murrelli]